MSGLVHQLQSIHHAAEQRDDRLLWKAARMLRQPPLERLAFLEIHDDVRGIVDIEQLMDAHNIPMIEARQHAPNAVIIARADAVAKAERERYWRAEMQREKMLFENGAVSRQEYEDERAQASAAQADAEAATLAPLRRQHANLELIQGNVISMAPRELVGEVPYKLIANILYNTTSAPLRPFLDDAHLLTLMVLLL